MAPGCGRPLKGARRHATLEVAGYPAEVIEEDMKPNPDEAFAIIQALALEASQVGEVPADAKRILNDIHAVARYKYDCINYSKRSGAPRKYTVVDRENGDLSQWVGFNPDALRADVSMWSNDPEKEYVLMDQHGAYCEFDGTPITKTTFPM